MEKRACTLLKAYFRERPFSLAKKTFFSPSLSLRLFEQLRYGQSCKGSKNHPQRHYPQVFWVIDTSSHFCLSFEERVRVFGFFPLLLYFRYFLSQVTSAAGCAKECSADPECNGWSHFHPKDRFDVISAPSFLTFSLLFHCLTFSFHSDILNKIIPSEVRFYILCRCYIKSSLKGTIVEFPGTESGLRPCL